MKATRLVWLCTLLALAPPAAAFDDGELAALGDGHFARLHGFDALEAYRVSKGPASGAFTVMRRWSRGRAEVLIDVLEPASLGKVAFLMLQNPDRVDDLFVYVPDPRVNRVRRFHPRLFERPVFELFSLSDLRPVSPGELAYTRFPDEEVEGETCTILVGRPQHRGLDFDRVELALSQKSGFALRTRYFRTGRETRRVLISPDDLRQYGDRWLPKRRRILVGGDGTPTELELVNVRVDPGLSEKLFTRHSLRAQRFPSF